MTALWLVSLSLLLGEAPKVDPEVLVQKLGAGRFADREAAAEALEQLGRAALSTLKNAKMTDDLEIRNRVGILIDRIEMNLMIRPTMLQLDFHDQPVMEVVKALGERSHIPLALYPDQELIWKDRRVTLERSEPIPFWEALDVLCQTAGLQYNTGMPMGGMGPNGAKQPAISLFQTTPMSQAVPSIVTGPFRINMASIQFHRERNFNLALPIRDVAPPGLPIARRRQGFVAPTQSSEQFFANLQILAEPRMAVTMTGPIRLIEVIDDLGQSLVPPPVPSGNGFQHSAGYNRFEVGGSTSLQVQAHLQYPEKPGQKIRKFQGSIPLSVSARRDDPLVISLADAKGSTFRNDEMTLTLNEVRTETLPGQTLIDLTMRSNQSPVSGIAAPEANIIRVPGNPQSQIELIAASGTPVLNWMTATQNYGPDGLRITIRVMNRDGLEPPTQIRFYELARATIDAEFLFTDIEMP